MAGAGLLYWTGLTLTLLLAILVAFVGLGRSSLWVDEAFTWWFTQMPWLQMMAQVRLDGVNPPFYYLVVKAVNQLLEPTEANLRLVSAIAYVLTVILGVLIGRQAAGRVGAIAGAWLMAFHPMAVAYARDARPYSLVTFFAAATTLAFLRFLAGDDRWRLRISALTSLVLGMLTHYFFLVLAGVLSVVAALGIRRRPDLFRRWATLTLLAYLPLGLWVAWYLAQPDPSLGIGWIKAPRPRDLALTMWNLLSGYGGVHDWPSGLFGGITSLLTLVAVAKPAHRIPVRQFLIVGFGVPLIGVWLLSQRRPIYVDRYFIVLLPLLSVLIACAAERVSFWLRGHLATPTAGLTLGPVLLLGLVLVGLASALQVHINPKFEKEAWQELTEYITASGASDSRLLLSEEEIVLPLWYYGLGAVAGSDVGLAPCSGPCWWVFRQPYTQAHAFSQAVTDPDRPWEPRLPLQCRLLSRWKSMTGIGAWQVACSP